MTTVSQKALKELLTLGIAQDATHCDIDRWNSIKATYKVIAVSTGRYGINGCLLEDTTTPAIYVRTFRNLSELTYTEINACINQNINKYYVIIGRVSRLFEIC